MKIIITLLFFSLFSFPIYSQLYCDGVPLDGTFKGKYISIDAKCLSVNKVYAKVDFGQAKPANLLERNVHYLSDKNGKRIRFNSPIGIMNLMYENGFEAFYKSDSTNCIIYARIE